MRGGSWGQGSPKPPASPARECPLIVYTDVDTSWYQALEEIQLAPMEHALSIAKFRVTLEMGLRQRALLEAEEIVVHWPAEQQQAAIQEALVVLKRQNTAARWAPDVFEAKARTVILEHLVPGMLPQIRLSTLKDVHPITCTVLLNEKGPEVPLYYTDEKGKRRRIIPDWAFTLTDADDDLDFFLETDRSTMTNHDFFLESIV